jgi:hypothetical protein
MRFAADPVLVAVALGLLSELALDESEPDIPHSDNDSRPEPGAPQEEYNGLPNAVAA